MKSKKRKSRRITVNVVGTVRFREQSWTVGTSPLRKRGERGCVLTPIAAGQRSGVILISTHLPANGPMAMEAMIHESLHVTFPRAREQAIQQAAHFVRKVILTYQRAVTTE